MRMNSRIPVRACQALCGAQPSQIPSPAGQAGRGLGFCPYSRDISNTVRNDNCGTEATFWQVESFGDWVRRARRIPKNILSS